MLQGLRFFPPQVFLLSVSPLPVFRPGLFLLRKPPPYGVSLPPRLRAARPASILPILLEGDWGLMKLPPHVLPPATGAASAANLAGDACDYAKNGYRVVIVAADGLPQGGAWLDALESAFRELGKPMPPVIHVRAGAESALRTRLEATA